MRDAGDVGGDLRLGEQLPRLVAAGRVADLGGAAAHQHDGPMSGSLQVAQQHDLHEAADVQAVGRRVEADVGRDALRSRARSRPSASVIWWM